jgi:RNA polymerase sigma-70 factor (ECF subfamily)
MMDPVTARADQHVGADVDLSGTLVEKFEVFYAREFSSVVRLAHVLTGSRAAAEDLAQDAFVAAYRRWSKLSGYDDPAAWVRRVVANRSVSRYRRLLSEANARFRLQQERPTPEEWSAATEEVWRAVRRLPRRQAQVIVLKYVDRASVGAIAATLRCSENTVKTHLARGREALAVLLGKGTDDDDDS